MGFKSLSHNWLRRFGFQLGLGNLAVLGALLWYSGITLKERVQWVNHTHEVLAVIFDLSSHLERAETTQRGYFISGDREFLSTYRRSITELMANLETVQTLTKDNPLQAPRIAEIGKLIEMRLAMMNEVLILRQNGKIAEGQKLISSPERRQFTEKIRAAISEVADSEKELLAARMKDAASTENWLVFLALTATLTTVGFVTASRRITVRDNAKLNNQQQLLNSIINSMSEGVVVVDHEGRYVQTNKASEYIIGATENIASTHVAANAGFFDPATEARIQPENLPSRRALRGEDTNDFQILVRNEYHPDGLIVSTNARPLRSQEGEVVGAVSVFRDISKQKEIERERINAREAALEASRKKSDFLATMSHEIRTPMNGIIGMSTLMLDSKMSSEQFEFVSTIKKSAESLVGLINGILDHSKIEAGKLTLHRFDGDLSVIAEDISEMFKHAAREKDLKLEMIYDVRANWAFHGDPDRIRQILVNLVGNAIKFTEGGGVTTRFFRKPATDPAKMHVRIEVVDTGPGLSAADVAQLFSKYGQTAAGQAKGGSGLGLTIARQLAQLMGGDMGVISEPGQGANFWFEIEVEEAMHVPLREKKVVAAAPQMRAHILVVEDQPVNVRVLGKFLEKLGITYDVAGNGDARR